MKVRRHDIPEYRIWIGMIGRCTCPTNTVYRYYGGRGVRICTEWRQSFDAFFAFVGPRPGKRYWIERIDSNGHYEPGNVRWATIVEQQRNRSNTFWIEFMGEVLCVREWGERTGIKSETLRKRIKAGWSADRALTIPTGGSSRVRNSC